MSRGRSGLYPPFSILGVEIPNGDATRPEVLAGAESDGRDGVEITETYGGTRDAVGVSGNLWKS